MIIDLKKYLFFGAKHEIGRFFEEAQEKGFVEFIGKKKQILDVPKKIANFRSAIKILRKQPVLEQSAPKIGDAEELSSQILSAEASLLSYEEEQRVLHSEIARVHIFGDFDENDIGFIEHEAKRFIQYYCIKFSRREQIEIPEGLIYIGTEFDLDYFVGVQKKKAQYPHFIEMQIEKPVGVLRKRLEWVQVEIKKLESQLKSYAAHFNYLQKALVSHLNHHHLLAVKGDVEMALEDQVFAIEAWVPETKITQMKKLIAPMVIEAVSIDADPTDRVPTCMENKKSARIGEDLVKIYDVPSTDDKDPSLWVLFTFSVFFAMIVADAGYGLLYLGLACFLKWKFPKAKDFLKRMIQLVFLLATTCTIWGFLTASFFGIDLGIESPLRKVSMIHYLAEEKAEYHIEKQDDVAQQWAKAYPATEEAKTPDQFFTSTLKVVDGEKKYEALDEFYDNILMEIALLVGVIHVSLGFVRYIRRNWSGLGWICFMIGGYLFFPSILHATSLLNFLGVIPKEVAYPVGQIMIWVGVSFAVVSALIQKGKGGLEEIANVIQVFADILSYLRLYALALASMIMAMTFNKIAGGMPIYIGVFVLIVGHGVNIVMGIMGGVIHGLRLNFLEWYHYCFNGGGKIFNPLRLLKLK